MKNIHTQNEKYPSLIAGDVLISGILYEHQRVYGYGKVNQEIRYYHTGRNTGRYIFNMFAAQQKQ